MIRYTGINHLALATGDLDSTIRFWRDLLGLRMVLGYGHEGFRQYFFEISETDMIAFFEWKCVEPLPLRDHGSPVKGPLGFDHVSLGVASERDLRELKDRLDAAGIWVSEVVDHGFILSVYAFDPNGIPIEFSSHVKGVDIRKKPVFKDSDPCCAAIQGSEPVGGFWREPDKSIPESEWISYPGEGKALFYHET